MKMMFCSNPTLHIVDVRILMKTTLTPFLSNLYNNSYIYEIYGRQYIGDNMIPFIIIIHFSIIINLITVSSSTSTSTSST
jgi:hypothetical protein